MNPVVLAPNGVERFYLGGPAIAALRGLQPDRARVPEDWIASTTEAFGEPGVGLSVLPDGRLLRDAIAADPLAWLGGAHHDRWGADPALLVKLLDAGERLPVHAHPRGDVARERLGSRFGKNEAWIAVGGSGPVWVGWREAVSAEQLRAWVVAQDAQAMLDALHRVELSTGDSVVVPAAVPHAIGAGLLIVELQEPSDMSILLEHRGTGVEDEDTATVGLGWPAALEAVEHDDRDPTPLILRTGAHGRRDAAFAPAGDPFFSAEWLRPGATPIELDEGFCVITAIEGAGCLATPQGERFDIGRGHSAVVPYAAGRVAIGGHDAVLLRSRPSMASEARRAWQPGHERRTP